MGTNELMIILFSIISVIIVLAVWQIIEFFDKVRRGKGKYSKMDKIVIPHNISKQQPTFMEKRFLKKGLRFYRLIFYSENGELHSIKSISEARIKTVGRFEIVEINKQAYIIDDTLVKTVNNIPTLNYVINFPKPIQFKIPHKKSHNPEMNVKFFNKSELYDIINDKAITQLNFDEDKEKLTSFLAISVFLNIITLIVIIAIGFLNA